jgi:hypothetical protein
MLNGDGCVRCGVEVTAERGNFGVVLYDDHVGLEGSYEHGLLLCDSCRDEFETWLRDDDA